ncbi:5-formyltetrahydrofolate cyclo-ligase [Hypoxylon fragiforme]|uniref:5-formyltetrahydrofolate cyclo-ligase n=1 Tax=Hypoxylon fragiforme TaxID=63214 RepID=UPI0020C7095B|nr:5-formyltetrahydrofolate cyclo-ligase [Hypoxylon fragiforme]KAI2607598.1 5-formyltetrahydrofolate cyclo-ligase [Hypoxylon fragiforme]
MNPSTLSAIKLQVRSVMKQRLADLPQHYVESQSAKVFDTISKFKPYVDAKRVAVYLSMPSGEIQTDSIVRHALTSGKQVFVPYLHKSGLRRGDGPARLMDMVSLKNIEDYESLQRDKWGIPSIDPATVDERKRSVGELVGKQSEDVSLDLILMPGVAFDIQPTPKTIRRLGHGGGFYDYFLHRYALAASPEERTTNGRPAVLLYALAFEKQLLCSEDGESVPVEPHDQPIDGLILGNGQIEESAKSGENHNELS